MLMDIVISKKGLVKNRLYNINKYIMWFIDIRDLVLDYMDQELDKNKIYEFMNFLYLIKYKDIVFIDNKSYKIIELEDEEYKVKFILDDEFKIEYTVKESNTNYLFNVNESNDYSSITNIIYKQVKDNINDIFNKEVYYICKQYFLYKENI